MLASLLSEAERARAGRFRVPGLAGRYTVAHARLRQILAAQLGTEPGALQFAAGPHGKPELAGAFAGSGLRFNLSHSAALGLVGWTRGRDIGVDVEAWRGMRDEAALVRRYFSPVEIAAYEASPADARTEVFFNLWTRKEAYVKAVGRGLGLPLDSFDVSPGKGQEARLLRPSSAIEDPRHWSLAAPAGPPRASLAIVTGTEELSLQPA